MKDRSISKSQSSKHREISDSQHLALDPIAAETNTALLLQHVVGDVASGHSRVDRVSPGFSSLTGKDTSAVSQTGAINHPSAEQNKPEEPQELNRAVRRRSRCKSPGPSFHAVLCSDDPAPVQRLLFDDASGHSTGEAPGVRSDSKVEAVKPDGQIDAPAATKTMPEVTPAAAAVTPPVAAKTMPDATPSADVPADTLAGLVAAAMKAPVHSNRELARAKVAELRELCRQAGLAHSGTKAILVARLLACAPPSQSSCDLDLLPSPSKTFKEPLPWADDPSSQSRAQTFAAVPQRERAAKKTACARPAKNCAQPTPQQSASSEVKSGPTPVKPRRASGSSPARRSTTNSVRKRRRSSPCAKARGGGTASPKPTFGTPKRRARSGAKLL